MNWYASYGYSFMKYPGWNRKEAAGEGAGRHTRGRVCSPERFPSGPAGGGTGGGFLSGFLF